MTSTQPCAKVIHAVAGLLALLLFSVSLAAHSQTDDSDLLTPAPFTAVEISGTAEVTLRQGDRDQVRLLDDAESRRSVDAHVVDGRLVLRTLDTWKFWSRGKPRVDVQMRELRRLVISGESDVHLVGAFRADSVSVAIAGSGRVRMDDLQADSLRFDVSGAGEGELAGQVRDLRLSVSGKGKLAAEKLRADRARVSISGIGQADVWVVQELRTSVSGIGTINYWGNPSLTRSNSGIATVEAKGMKR